MPMVVTTMSRHAVRLSTKKPIAMLNLPAGIQSHSANAAPWVPNGAAPVRAANTTTIAAAHDATTASTGTTGERLRSRRPNSAVNANPARGRAGMSGTSVSIRA